MRSLMFVLVISAACAQREQPAAQQQRASPASAQTSATGVQEHTINVGGEFTPASLMLKAGQPARLIFRRGDEATCADEIVLPEMNMRKKIAANETVTFDLPPQKARTLNFVCGMNMMKGTVIVQ